MPDARSESMPDAERTRLSAGRDWKRWGPYLSERAWGTVREDYSAGGTAWEYFPHDHARSRTYRWNEDGLGGICDEPQELCLAFAFWNGRGPRRAGRDGAIEAEGYRFGRMALLGAGHPELLFCENESNAERLWGVPGSTPYPKDGLNDHVVHGAATVNPELNGSKAALL